MNTDLALYANLLGDIKSRIRQAQNRAALAVNAELVRLYWDIGRLIDQRQEQEGWSAGVIPRLARDLKNELPELKGFSERNLGHGGLFPGLPGASGVFATGCGKNRIEKEIATARGNNRLDGTALEHPLAASRPELIGRAVARGLDANPATVGPFGAEHGLVVGFVGNQP